MVAVTGTQPRGREKKENVFGKKKALLVIGKDAAQRHRKGPPGEGRKIRFLLVGREVILTKGKKRSENEKSGTET